MAGANKQRATGCGFVLEASKTVGITWHTAADKLTSILQSRLALMHHTSKHNSSALWELTNHDLAMHFHIM